LHGFAEPQKQISKKQFHAFFIYKMSENIPIGEIITQKLKANDRSIAWLARKANCDRSNFCKKLKSNNVEIDLLFRISEIMQEDFFAHYSKLLNGKTHHENTQN